MPAMTLGDFLVQKIIDAFKGPKKENTTLKDFLGNMNPQEIEQSMADNQQTEPTFERSYVPPPEKSEITRARLNWEPDNLSGESWTTNPYTPEVVGSGIPDMNIRGSNNAGMDFLMSRMAQGGQSAEIGLPSGGQRGSNIDIDKLNALIDKQKTMQKGNVGSLRLPQYGR
ncbi:MAG: hypothetical protein KKD01_19800 [Proteobacteria bacterium]|nr:hypothetical protein [Pseudomonadota bacterium]